MGDLVLHTLHGHVSVPCAHIIVTFFAVDESDIDGVTEWQVLHRYPLTHHDDSVVMSLDSRGVEHLLAPAPG